ncbi:MAG: AraC family transcriptional regulator [Actinomycetota bacterium]
MDRESSTAPRPMIADDPVAISFAPAVGRRDLPAEVFEIAELRDRIPSELKGRWERLDLHFLVLGLDGVATWGLDFADHVVTSGSVLRVRPGQLVRHPFFDGFDGLAMVWAVERHPAGIDPPSWRSELAAPVHALPDEARDRLARWLGDLRDEQRRFDGSKLGAALITSMVRTVLLAVANHADSGETRTALPQPYVDLRDALADSLFDRPTVASLAATLGYSTRTLDRACQAVSRQSAKQVVDERVTLELRRMLADERTPITEVRLAFGFAESSNFTKFVRRVTGRSPSEFRRHPD